MELKYNATGSDRKRLVTAMAEIMECAAKYKGAPTFAYEVDYFTIDKNGIVTFDDRADSDEVEMLVEALLEKGFEPEKQYANQLEEAGDSLVISYPRKDISDIALENLRLLVASKEALIKKALGVDALPIEVDDEKVSFPWFTGFPQPEKISAYAHFTGKLIGMMEEIQKIPSAVTQQIFLRYYYDGCPWSVVAKSVGIGVQAAKMRRQRYLETEDERHAV